MNTRFLIQATWWTAWDHSEGGRDLFCKTSFMSAIMDWVRLFKVQLACLETLFSCSVYTFVSSHLILLSAKYVLNIFKVYSPLPSMHRILRTFPVSFSAHAFHHLKMGRASSLDLQSPT